MDAAQCSPILIKSTYKRSEATFRDWRLADKVNETTYNELKQGADANATIYGIPIGASWQDFRENIYKYSRSRTESLVDWKTVNILWTGIQDNVVEAYKSCIQAAINDAVGLHMYIVQMGTHDIMLHLRWNPMGADHARAHLEWAGALAGTPGLPVTIDPGPGMSIIVPRPREETSLAVNVQGQGAGDAVLLYPLPPAPPQLPINYKITNNPNTQPLQQGKHADWVTPEMDGGTYNVSVSLTAREQHGQLLRIAWGLSVNGLLIASSGDQYDIAPNSTNTIGGGGIVTLQRGDRADINLYIGGMWDNADFQHFSGQIVLEQSAHISISKI